MRERQALWMMGLALAGALGCSGTTKDEGPQPVDEFPKEQPATIEGAIVFHFPEIVVPAATDQIFCQFLEPEKEDVYISSLTSYQGVHGHHLVIFAATDQEPANTVRDCTTPQDMTNLIPIVSSVNFGLAKFPEGMAVRVKKGTQLVLQQHYLNTTEHAIRTHDVSMVTTRKLADVKVTAGFYGTSDINFKLEATPGKPQTVKFECEIPHDLNVLLMGPHMHEWGQTFLAEAGPHDAMQKIIDIPKWDAKMRDFPPVKEYTGDAPLVLKKGDFIRTTCVFNNTTGKPLVFPHEMCATYGYYFPAPEGSEEWTCAGTKVE